MPNNPDMGFSSFAEKYYEYFNKYARKKYKSFLNKNSGEWECAINNAWLTIHKAWNTFKDDCPRLYWVKKVFNNSMLTSIKRHNRRIGIIEVKDEDEIPADNCINSIPEPNEIAEDNEFIKKCHEYVNACSEIFAKGRRNPAMKDAKIIYEAYISFRLDIENTTEIQDRIGITPSQMNEIISKIDECVAKRLAIAGLGR